MQLRSVELRNFGRFDTCNRDFRRGLNLLTGPSESGKSTLLAAVPAVLFGAGERDRIRPWLRSEECRAAVVFEAAGRTLRVERDFVTDAVVAEVGESDGQCSAPFRARLPADGSTPEHVRYRQLLQNFFGCEPQWLQAVLEGRMEVPAEGAVPSRDPALELADVQKRLGELERSWYATRERMKELPVLREAIASRAGAAATAAPEERPRPAPVAPLADAAAPTDDRRAFLERELSRTGLPRTMPSGLPELLEQAGGIRAEMVAIQGESNVLRQELRELPFPPWKGAVSLALLFAAAGVSVGWFAPYWLPAGLVAGGVAALLPLFYAFWRALQARAERREIETLIAGLDVRREEAQKRLNGLDEQFRRLGVSSAAVEVVRMEKNLERHRQMLRELGELPAATAASPQDPPAGAGAEKAVDSAELELAELRRQEAELVALPETLRQIESEGEQLREREAALLRGELPGATASPSPASPLLPQLIAEAGSGLAQLSGGRYCELRDEADGSWSLRTVDGLWQPLAQCGGGTEACARLALSAAMARNCGSGSPLPLLLDEPLAQLDRTQAGEALRLLERLAAGQQIILGSRDENLSRKGGRERWHLLPLGEQPPRRSQPTTTDQERNDDDGQLHLL